MITQPLNTAVLINLHELLKKLMEEIEINLYNPITKQVRVSHCIEHLKKNEVPF